MIINLVSELRDMGINLVSFFLDFFRPHPLVILQNRLKGWWHI